MYRVRGGNSGPTPFGRTNVDLAVFLPEQPPHSGSVPSGTTTTYRLRSFWNDRDLPGVFMNEQNTIACWTAARWTIAASLGIVALVWFFGGFETTALAIPTQ